MVFVVADDKAERRAISLAERRNGEALLDAGLVAGERVIVQASDGLSDGIAVRERR